MERLVVTFPSGPGTLPDGTPKTHYGIRVRMPDGSLSIDAAPMYPTVAEASEQWGKLLFSLCHEDVSDQGFDRDMIHLAQRGMVEVLGAV